MRCWALAVSRDRRCNALAWFRMRAAYQCFLKKMIWEKVRCAWTCMCARQLARRSAYILLFNIDSACHLRSKWQLEVFARVTVCTISGGSYQNVLPCNLLSAVLDYKIPCFSFFHFFSLLCKLPGRQLTAMRTHCNEIALYWQAYISVRMCPCITARAQRCLQPE